MYIVNSGTCSISLFLSRESHPAPRWQYSQTLLVARVLGDQHRHSATQHTPGNHCRNNTTGFLLGSFNAHGCTAQIPESRGIWNALASKPSSSKVGIMPADLKWKFVPAWQQKGVTTAVLLNLVTSLKK